MARVIELSRGYTAIVDQIDYKSVNHYKWSTSSGTRKLLYAVRSVHLPDGTYRRITLHRFLMNVFDPAVLVDHIDGNGLNCTRKNMRLVTALQNTWNTKPRHPSGKKGVTWDNFTNSWKAQIRIEGKNIHLGRFFYLADAAAAYAVAAEGAFGEFAYKRHEQ